MPDAPDPALCAALAPLLGCADANAPYVRRTARHIRRLLPAFAQMRANWSGLLIASLVDGEVLDRPALYERADGGKRGPHP